MIRRTRVLTAFPSSTYLIAVLWTTVLSHCSYSEAGCRKNGETHYAERKKERKKEKKTRNSEAESCVGCKMWSSSPAKTVMRILELL